MTIELEGKQIRFIEMMLQECVEDTVQFMRNTDDMEQRRRSNAVLTLCSEVNKRIADARKKSKDALICEKVAPARTLVREFEEGNENVNAV